MQRTLHERFSGTFVKIILVVIGVVFGGLFGIQGYLSSRLDTFVAKVDGKEISQQEFRERFDLYRNSRQRQLGAAFDARQFDTPENKREVLDGMINEKLVQQASEKLGVVVTPQRVYDEIASYPQFQTDGKFDKHQYSALLARQNMSPGHYEDMVRQDLLTRELPYQLAQSGVVTEKDVDDYLRLRDQTRDFRFVKLDKPAAGDLKNDDAAVEAYYKAHGNDFLTAEKVSLDYLEIDGAKMVIDDKVDDATLKDQYEKQKARYVEPEQRLASHILIAVDKNADAAAQKAALEKAQKIAAEAKSTKDFAALAKANSDDAGSKAQGGDLGWLKKGDTDPAFDAALFAMKKGDVSEPVKSEAGYHIIQLRDLKEEKSKPFEQVKAELAKQYVENERATRYAEQAGKLTDESYSDPASLATPAKDLGLTVQKTALFGRSGGQGIAANPKVIAAAFSNPVLNEGSNSDPIEIGPNHVVIVRVDQHEKPAPKPLAEVRDEIRKRLIDEQVGKQAKERADTLFARLQKGETLDKLADELKAKVTEEKDIGRNAANVDRAIVAEAFKLPRPAGPDKPGTAEVALADGSYALIAVSGVKDGDPSKADATTREAALNTLRQAASGLNVRGFVDSLRKSAKIEIAEDRLQ